MGNVSSGETVKEAEKGKSLNEIIHFIASNYILSQSFTDMESLKDEKYCDQLIIVTSDVLGKYLTKMDVEYLDFKIKQGVEVNETGSDNLLYLRKEDVNKIDVKNRVTKKRMCIGIAKYYIKIAHIFSSIVTTINPMYKYRDVYGTHHTVSLQDKNKIPHNATDIRIDKVNLCNERINALVNGQDLSMNDPTQPIKIKPNFCKMNMNKKASEEQRQHITASLIDEEGISQLERLYKDVYNYETGKFTGMSPQMREDYHKDLEILYKAFTGKEHMPKSIQSFKDIPLRDFQAMDGCKATPNNHFMHEYEGTSKQKLFVDYANHVNEMMRSATKNKDALIGVLDKLFVFAVNPQTKKNEITINPKLTDDILNGIVRETQQLIIKLYIACQTDFIKGLGIFEQIIGAQINAIKQQEIDKLNKEMELNKLNPFTPQQNEI